MGEMGSNMFEEVGQQWWRWRLAYSRGRVRVAEGKMVGGWGGVSLFYLVINRSNLVIIGTRLVLFSD